MNRSAHTAVAPATRPNRILLLLAAAWMAAAIAIGGFFTAQPADASASSAVTGVAGTAQR
jgi:hypothetical protein